jgi:hypothetical protein
VVGVQAIGEATDKARVEAEGLVSVAAVAAEDGADGTGAKVQGRTGVTLEAKTNAVDGVSDGVEERGDGAGNEVALDDGEVAEGLVEVEAGEEAVDEGIALDDGEVANSLVEAEAADNALLAEETVEEVTLGGNIDVDVVDDVLDLANNAALDLGTDLDAVEDVLDVLELVADDGLVTLGDVQATDSVEEAVDGAADAVADEAVDEVAGLDTDLDTVDSVLDVADSSADSSRKSVVDDAALDIEAEARNDGKAAGDCADVDNVVETAESLTLGGHGEGGRRKGESDESVLHLE